MPQSEFSLQFGFEKASLRRTIAPRPRCVANGHVPEDAETGTDGDFFQHGFLGASSARDEFPFESHRGFGGFEPSVSVSSSPKSINLLLYSEIRRCRVLVRWNPRPPLSYAIRSESLD
jgi:hypothetical protein